jgi:hypothetical protein
MTTKTELRGRIRTGRRAMSGLCVLITVTGVLSGAENPFVGTWKLNPNLS